MYVSLPGMGQYQNPPLPDSCPSLRSHSPLHPNAARDLWSLSLLVIHTMSYLKSPLNKRLLNVNNREICEVHLMGR